jgi:uncharacterized hydrophobic protein (TIGR00271 family)
VYKLRAICPPNLTADLVRVLSARDDVGRITHHEPAERSSSSHVLETEIQDHSVQAVLQMLAGQVDFQAVEVYLRPIQDVEHYRFERGRPVAVEDEAEAINISVGSREFRRLIRVDYQYVLLMVAAAVVATAGLIGDLPIAVVGAMAFSPDLGRLNAMAFAVISREWPLLLRGATSLVVGMMVVIGAAAGVTLLLSLGTLTDPLSAIPDLLIDFVTIVDGVTVTVAAGAGVAAMVVFISDRGTAAVGVGVSITTIPAAAYAGIAFADGNWSSGWDALVVLGVNILCVIAAGVVTGLVLRRHLEHRARAMQNTRSSHPT